ncbi:hypothetical protein HZA97_03160 [Candidatus Woesearchaeota archaeon]|nr:hypothetical protein [Candidatus Woesearchaeota archaeon]
MKNYLCIQKQRKKKFLEIVKAQSPLRLEEFIEQYLHYFRADTIAPRVFSDLQEFREFLKEIPDKRPIPHNSCIDESNTVCVHYMNGKAHCKVALYGYKITYHKK